MEVSVVGKTYVLSKGDDTGAIRTERALALLDEVIEFPEGVAYRRLEPVTDFRKCHDGSPAEGRILFTCRRLGDHDNDEEMIMKVKIQVPDESRPGSQSPSQEPSDTTIAEVDALKRFTLAKADHVPHLLSFKQDIQGESGFFPGGYVTFTVMTKMPGRTLYDMIYWSLSIEERKEIQKGFMEALKAVWAAGVEPIDCALRNILWCRQTKKSSIIDFELWERRVNSIVNQEKTLQRWGVVRRAPPATWHDEWFLHH